MKRLAVLCAAALLGTSVFAQVLPPSRGVPMPPVRSQSVPQFRSRVDLVHLDVSVLDQSRRPVKGLGPADFVVFENGVRQTITVFSSVDIPDPAPPKVAWMRDVAPDVRMNADVLERRLFVIIVDDATLDLDMTAVKNVKTAAARVIDGLGPSDLAAVVFTADNRHAQDFTADRARLRAAVESYRAGLRAGAVDDLFFRYSVNTLQSAVRVLSRLPDRRKAIVYIGQGIPLDLPAAFGPEAVAITEVVMDNISKPSGGSNNPGNKAMTSIGEMARLASLAAIAFADAARANVNIYSIDVCGLRTGPRASGAVTASELMSAGATADSHQTCKPGLEVDYLTNLASATGGRAIINTNDFSRGVTDMFAENASYYLLGYQSSDQRMDGKLRRLDVRVNRPGVQVRTRTGYTADKADDARRKAELKTSAIGAALAGVLPKSDLAMQLSAAPFAIPGSKEAAVAVILGVYQPIPERTAQAVEKIDLLVRAFNVDGKSAGATRLVGEVIVRPDEKGLGHYEALASINLKPGRYQLRTAADVSTLATSGSLYYDVDVPDFSGAPVSLSGLLLSAVPAPIAAPRDALKAIVPVVPTTKRTFDAGEKASIFARVYQGGKQPPGPVAITTRLQSDADVTVVDRTETLAGSSFNAARSADLRFELPIGLMAPGSYLLTIEATLGKTTARRQMRLMVR